MDPSAEQVIEVLPDASEQSSFENSLEQAFAAVEQAAKEPEKEQKGSDQAVEESTSDSAEKLVEEEEGDPIESLSDDVGDDWTPKAANRFKQLKEELKSSKSELEQLRQMRQEYEEKIKELSGMANDKSAEDLKQKLAEYEQQQMLTNLEATEAYSKAVREPLAAIVKQADELADKYGANSEALIEALSMDDAKAQDERIAELLPEATERDKAKIYRLIEDIDPILQRRQQLFENADQALKEAKELEKQKAESAAAERARVRQNVTRNVVERVQQRLPFLAGIDGLDLKAVQEKAAATDPTVIHPVDFAYNAVSAQLLPTLVRQYITTRKEVEALTDKLAEYESAEPTTTGRSRSDAGGSVSSDLPFEARVAQLLGG